LITIWIMSRIAPIIHPNYHRDTNVVCDMIQIVITTIQTNKKPYRN
jgi:hypothetical protein